jgi:hypothetical protein
VGHPPVEERSRAFCGYDITMPAKPYIVRDDEIIAASEEMLACPRRQSVEEQRSGTWTTIRHALLADKPVTIVWPNGRTVNAAEWYRAYGRVKSVLEHLNGKVRRG